MKILWYHSSNCSIHSRWTSSILRISTRLVALKSWRCIANNIILILLMITMERKKANSATLYMYTYTIRKSWKPTGYFSDYSALCTSFLEMRNFSKKTTKPVFKTLDRMRILQMLFFTPSAESIASPCEAEHRYFLLYIRKQKKTNEIKLNNSIPDLVDFIRSQFDVEYFVII